MTRDFIQLLNSCHQRRQTLLVDMQHRHKVGGILDQRFGENDPTMTPEEKMLERFAREKLKSHKKSSMFDLEDDEDEPTEGLTHGGKALAFDDEDPVDDFEERDLEAEDSDGSVREQQRLKRVRAMDAGGLGDSDGADDGQPERKKTKKEVMEEIIAKSKLHKSERQQAKEDDEDLRAELDKDLPDLQRLLSQNLSKRQTNGDTQAASIGGVDRDTFDRNFDVQVRKLAQDRRAQPADRTKTEEEKAEDESKRLKTLEEKRQKRMRGEPVTDSEDDEEDKEPDGGATGQGDMDEDDDFGLGGGIRTRPTATELGFDDEDDFIIDDDLVASGSDLEPVESDVDSEQDDEASEDNDDEEEEDEFTKGLLNEEEARNPMFTVDSSEKASALKKGDENGLPYTFPCPQAREDLEAIIKDYPLESLPTIVQRIRALYHPKLDSKNKDRLANFSMALVDFIASPFDAAFDSEIWPSFSVLESLIRHIHSLSKMFPIEISQSCRHLIEKMSRERPLALEVGDLVLLTTVGTIFPTSDHFHQVVTPAMLANARYLGQKVPRTLADHAVGIYISILSLQYQQLSKRYIPEVINFILNTLCSLAPTAPALQLGRFPLHESEAAVRAKGAKEAVPRRLNFADCVQTGVQGKKAADVKIAILDTALQVCDAAADAWTGKDAFVETFDQVLEVVRHLSRQKSRTHLPSQLCERVEKLQTKLERMIRVAALARRPLELHHHRPLAIKTYIPKFEETFDPDKHYDPDRERAELAKLKAEHKKERKGAMRELRKDANFMAREKLKIKKAKDEAYEKKYKRLVAEIQSEEGREANEYERVKKARKRAKDR